MHEPMSKGARQSLPAHPRSFEMPPQRMKKTARKSYRTADLLMAVVVIVGLASILLGYGVAYSAGYDAAINHYVEVRHG